MSLSNNFIKFQESLRVLSPLCVGQLLRYFEGYSSQGEALQYSGFIVIIVILLAVIHHLLFYDLQKLGWHARVATTALMYQKVFFVKIFTFIFITNFSKTSRL